MNSEEIVADEMFGALARAVGRDVFPDEVLEGLTMQQVSDGGDIVASAYLAFLTRLQDAAAATGMLVPLVDVLIEASRIAQGELL